MKHRLRMSATLPDVIDENILTCRLCMREAHQPKLLPCLHVFCQHCLQRYVRQWRDKHRVSQYTDHSPTANHSADKPDQSSATGRHDNQDAYDLPDGAGCDRREQREAPRKENSTKRAPLARSADRTVDAKKAVFYRNRFRLKSDNFRRAITDDSDDDDDGYEIPADYADGYSVCRRSGSRSSAGTSTAGSGYSSGDQTPGGPFTESSGHAEQHSNKTKVSKSNSSPSLWGRVSSMVNLFERKTSVSEAPPMAKFRTKTKTSPKPATKIVPLHERDVPVYDDHVMSGNQSRDSVKSLLAFAGRGDGSTGNRSKLNKSQSLTDDYYEILDDGRPSVVYDLATGTTDSTSADDGNVDGDGGRGRRPDRLDLKRAAPPARLAIRRTPSEHIYDEISSVSPSGSASGSGALLSPTRCLLREHPSSKDDHDIPRSRRSVRRNSSILDSYVTAGALVADGRELNVAIPLSVDDTHRLSQLYLRMDGVPLDGRRSRTSHGYMSMDQMAARSGRAAADEASKRDTVESITTLIRAISADFTGGQQTRSTLNCVERHLADIPDTAETSPDSGTPPLYVNVSDDQPQLADECPELDEAVPTYDTPSCPVSAYQLLEDRPTDGTCGAETDADADAAVRVACPSCGRLVGVPVQLSDCAFISQLQDVVSSQRCERKHCDNCEVRSAQCRCLDCFVYLCDGCRNGHNWSISNRGHKVMTLEQLQSGKYQTDMKSSQKTYCERDHTNEARYVCGHCNRLECSDCVALYCKNHVTRCIEEVASRDKDFIQARLRDLQRHQERLNGAVENLEVYQHHCAQSRDRVLDEISSHHDYLKLLLDQTFDLLRAKVKQAFSDELQRTSALTDEVQACLRSVDHVHKFTNQLLHHGNDANVVAMSTALRNELARMRDAAVPRMTSQLDVTYAVDEVDIRDLERLCGRVDKTTRELDGGTDGSADDKLVRQNTRTMRLLTEFGTRLPADVKGCRPNGLAVLSTGDIVVVDNINMKLKCFDGAGGQLLWQTCPSGDHALVDPWDVAALRDDVMAVTDKGARDVKLLARDGRLVSSFGGHLREPWGICTNSKRQILVTDTKLCRVFVHDAAGRLLDTIPSRAVRSQYQLECPEYVCSNGADDVIVSDFAKHCVLVFDLLGRPLFTFGRKGTGADEFYYPLGVTTDAGGLIYTVNYKNQRITVATRNGDFLCCLAADEPMQSLQATSIGREGSLVVIDGSKVKIFELPPKIRETPRTSRTGQDEDGASPTRTDVLILSSTDETGAVIRKETTV